MHTALIALADTEKCEALAALVQGALWRVVATASCTEARRRFPGRDFDVVFTEASLEGGGWYRAVHACRMAVLVDPPERLLVGGSLPAGFNACVSTPFDVDAIVAILDGIPPREGSGSVDGEGATTAHHPPPSGTGGALADSRRPDVGGVERDPARCPADPVHGPLHRSDPDHR